VRIASNGHLVLTGGHHSVLTLMSDEGQPAPGSVETFWHNHARRQAFCEARGIAFSTWVFPDKLSIFANDPAFCDVKISSVYRRHYLGHAPEQSCVHYLGDVIDGSEDFPKTDTHLSAAGMCKAVLAMAQSLDLPGQAAFAARVAETCVEVADHCGDLGVKLTPARTEQIRLARPPVPFQRGMNRIAAGNDGMMDLLHTPTSSTDKTLLVFGDSFFRQNLVYLTFFFRNIVFLRSRYFHDECVAAVAPDVIFTGLAERYLSAVSADAARPHFLSYPYVSGRAVDPSPLFAELWRRMIDGARLL
jgi:hypothetical protein